MDAYENLANAVILRAVEDYRVAMRRLAINPKYPEALRMKADCEEFFLSTWFSELTKLDGADLLKKLKEEAHER